MNPAFSVVMTLMNKLTILIPVYNEEKTVGKIIQAVAKIQLPKNVAKEIIIIDDGSSDRTLMNIKSTLLKLKNVDIKVLQHQKNKGKGSAVRAGIEKAEGDYVIIQDADLEYDPKDIARLMRLVLDKKTAVVYGTRLKRMPNLRKEERKPQFLLHYFGNRLLSLLTSVLYGQWLTDMETGYKLFPRKALIGIKLNAQGFEFEPEITAKLLKQGYKILEIPITTNPRTHEEGKKLNTIRDGIKAAYSLFRYRFRD